MKVGKSKSFFVAGCYSCHLDTWQAWWEKQKKGIHTWEKFALSQFFWEGIDPWRKGNMSSIWSFHAVPFKGRPWRYATGYNCRTPHSQTNSGTWGEVKLFIICILYHSVKRAHITYYLRPPFPFDVTICLLHNFHSSLNIYKCIS